MTSRYSRLRAAAVGLATLALGVGGMVASHPASAFTLKGKPKIAFIYAAAINDGGWDESLDAARKKTAAALGLPIATSESIPEDATALRAAIDLYVKHGYNIIVGTSYGYSDALLKAAKDYPDVAFLGASGTTNAANLESFYPRTYQGWYLAGMAAGAVTKTDKLGILGGYPVGVVNWDVNAFIRGAQAINPKVQVIAIYTNSWWDPVQEGKVAEAMLDQDADVIATDLSAASAPNAAEKRGKFAVGYQIDMKSYAPNGMLTSVVFKWDNYLTPTIKAIIAGSWKPDPYGAFVSIKTNTVDLTPISDKVPAEIRAKIKAARAQLEAGTLTPFDGPVLKQDGSVAVAAGAKMTDEQLWSMDYFVRGAIGKMPAPQK